MIENYCSNTSGTVVWKCRLHLLLSRELQALSVVHQNSEFQQGSCTKADSCKEAVNTVIHCWNLWYLVDKIRMCLFVGTDGWASCALSMLLCSTAVRAGTLMRYCTLGGNQRRFLLHNLLYIHWVGTYIAHWYIYSGLFGQTVGDYVRCGKNVMIVKWHLNMN